MQKSINKCMERTKNNTGITFNIAINYGGRDELVRSVKKIIDKQLFTIHGNGTQIFFLTEMLNEKLPTRAFISIVREDTYAFVIGYLHGL